MKSVRSASRQTLPLQEALPAVYRTALRRLKGYGGLLAALGTKCCSLDFTRSPPALAAPGFTGFTALGLISEVFVVEEKLLTRREDELGPTIRAPEDAVHKFWHLAPAIDPGATVLLLRLPPARLPYMGLPPC